MRANSPEFLRGTRSAYEHMHTEISHQIGQIDRKLSGAGKRRAGTMKPDLVDATKHSNGSRLSAKGRKAIALAQQMRWASYRGKKAVAMRTPVKKKLKAMAAGR